MSSVPSPDISPEFRDLQMAIYRYTHEFGEPLVHGEQLHILGDFLPESLDGVAIGNRATPPFFYIGQTGFEVTVDAFNESLGEVERGSDLQDGVYLNYTSINMPWGVGEDGIRRMGSFNFNVAQLDGGVVYVNGEMMGSTWSAYNREDYQAANELLAKLGIGEDMLFPYARKPKDPDDGYRIIEGDLDTSQILRVTEFIMNLSNNG